MITIFLFHLTLSILFGYIIYVKNNSLNNALTALLLALSLPGLGIIIFLKTNIKFLNPDVLESEATIEKQSMRDYFKNLDIRDETNVVSLEESLLISDVNQRREIMMKTLKKGNLNYFPFINKAIKNDDIETSHYAASSILNTRRVLDIKMRETSRKYKEEPDNLVIAKEYSNIIDKYISIFELDGDIETKYLEENILLLKKIIEQEKDFSHAYIIKLIDLLITTGNQLQAKKYCKILFTNYPDNEEKYLCLLQSYYEMKDKENFDLTLQQFINSEIIFSNEMLEIIRFWIKAPKER